jgi:succinate-semialdehyde dehydrogenase/glutarate-semialdehyde dehydrogenase
MSQAQKEEGRYEWSLSDPDLLRTQAYINGEWVDADNGATFPVYNPATGEVIADMADVGAAETRRAIEAAEVARHGWAAKSPHERSAVLRKWNDLLLENVEDLAVIMTVEQGKVLAESRGETVYSASFIEWFAEEAKRIDGAVLPQPQTDRRGIVVRQPVGVCAAITPWNFPSAMLARKAGPALAVGCSMVAKPPHETPLSMTAMTELAHRAGLPAGLLNIVPTATSRIVGAELCENPIVRKLTFTGSTGVGKQLTKQCADTLKRLSMELGGNAPVIVFDDADLKLAAKGAAASKYRNSGQTCICANRIMVQDTIYDEFVEELKKVVGTYKIGDGMDESVTHGPLISRKALEDIKELVDDAIDNGATVAAGGEFGEGDSHFVEPTILCDGRSTSSVRKKRRSRWPTIPSSDWPLTCLLRTRAAAGALRRVSTTAWSASTRRSLPPPTCPLAVSRSRARAAKVRIRVSRNTWRPSTSALATWGNNSDSEQRFMAGTQTRSYRTRAGQYRPCVHRAW